MNRSLKLSMVIALALGSAQLQALDLGQIQVKSTLGQPLLAEIPLHPASPDELRNLTVKLASSEDFARAGIMGGRTTIPLRFSLANTGGQQVIRITSAVAVEDPYLDLLLEVDGAAGKSVREFTILLDPPGSPAGTMASTAASAPTQRFATLPTQPAQQPAAPAAARTRQSPAPAPTHAGGQSITVDRGQTLSGIARDATPAGVDMRQMLLAIKQANPDAFYRDNINALKSGVVLRIPTASEAQSVALAAAVAEVRRQNSDWRAVAAGTPATVADAAVRPAATTGSAQAPADTSDRLALVPAKSTDGASSQGAGGNTDKATGSLRQDLLRAQETVASLQQQGTDLKTRLSDLAEINSKNERLLSLKDNQIAELQAKLAAARQTSGSTPAAVPAAAATVAEDPAALAESAPVETSPAAAGSVADAQAATAASIESTPVPVGAASAATASTPVVAAADQPESPPVETKPVPEPVAAQPVAVVEQPWYMQTWAWATGAGAAVVLLLLALLGRRRKPADAAALKAGTSLADRFGAAPADEQASGEGEEDIHQEELLDQLAENPDDIDLHLELVALYYSRRDVEHFEAAAEAMHAHISDPQQDEWQDVLSMGEDLTPSHPLFGHQPELPVHDEAEALRGFDIDDYSAADDEPAVASAPPPLPMQAPKKVSEYTFNFDLTSSPSHDQVGSAMDTPAEAISETADDTVDTAMFAPEGATQASMEPVESSEPPATSWDFDADVGDAADDAAAAVNDFGEFSDDPIDTKLDLARAYLDMGDAEGARAMLDEVLGEGSQMQKDVAKRLLDTMA